MRIREKEHVIEAKQFKWEELTIDTVNEFREFFGRECDMSLEFSKDQTPILTIDPHLENTKYVLRDGYWLVKMKPWGTDLLWSIFTVLSEERFNAQYEAVDDSSDRRSTTLPFLDGRGVINLSVNFASDIDDGYNFPDYSDFYR
jgi:hypothetical protein